MFRYLSLLLLAIGVLPVSGKAQGTASDAFDFSFTALDGTPMPLSAYKGKALLIVNTASLCGFTPQYGGLQALTEKYGARGLVVIGVPSSDFGNQEPGAATDIKKFTSEKFHITFPLTAKEHVTGQGAHPFYGYIRRKLGVFAAPKWNFYKYLVAPDGRVVAWFSSKVTPESPEMAAAIEAVLPRP